VDTNVLAQDLIIREIIRDRAQAQAQQHEQGGWFVPEQVMEALHPHTPKKENKISPETRQLLPPEMKLLCLGLKRDAFS
jgi:hypothetical protein